MSNFDKVFGGFGKARKMGTTSAPPRASKPLIPPKQRTNETGTRQEGKQNAIMDARDRQKYLADKAREREERRLKELLEGSKPARSFLRTLDKLSSEAQYLGYEDCDVDIADLAYQCQCHVLLAPQDRFLLYTQAREWLIGLAKREGVTRSDYFDAADYFDPDPDDRSLPALKKVLRLV